MSKISVPRTPFIKINYKSTYIHICAGSCPWVLNYPPFGYRRSRSWTATHCNKRNRTVYLFRGNTDKTTSVHIKQNSRPESSKYGSATEFCFRNANVTRTDTRSIKYTRAHTAHTEHTLAHGTQSTRAHTRHTQSTRTHTAHNTRACTHTHTHREREREN
jgi:hypothetical protein